MKSPRQPKQHQPDGTVQTSVAEAAARTLIIDESGIFIVPANRTVHGPRMEWGKRQWVRGAIIAIGIPSPESMTSATVSKLHRKVEALLAKDPNYKLGTVHRRTVANELKELQHTS
jgi:hypothetical protein